MVSPPKAQKHRQTSERRGIPHEERRVSSGTRCKTTCTTRNEKIAGSNQGPAITEIDSPAVRSGRRLIIEPIPSVSEPLPCDLAPWELAGTEQEISWERRNRDRAFLADRACTRIAAKLGHFQVEV